MEDREDTAFNCQTPSLLQQRLKRQLCQGLIPLLYKPSPDGAEPSDGGCFPGNAPFTPRRSSSSVEKLQHSSLSHAGNFNYIKNEEKWISPRAPGTSQSLGGGGGPSASHSKSLLEQQIPSIFVLIITNPPKELAELLPGAGPPRGSVICSVVTAGSRDAENLRLVSWVHGVGRGRQ